MRANRWAQLWSCLTVCVVFLTCLGSDETYGQVTLYDNLHLFPGAPGPAFGPRFESKNEDLAQQFFTGQSSSLTSVTLSLQRFGSPTGDIGVQIWDDNGSGVPGSVIDTIGSIDLPSLSTSPVQLTFDNLTTIVAPDSSYYVVLDNSATSIVSPSNSYHFGLVDDTEGTFGAGMVLTNGVVSDDWLLIRDPRNLGCHPTYGCPDFLHMSVTAAATPTPEPTPVFDNLHVPQDPRPEWQYINAAGPDRVFAQQFLMDNRRSLDEVVVSLSRQGSATGSIAFEIWSNSPSDLPMEKIADLGTIPDVSQLSPIPTAPSDVQFDNRVTGLTPENKYWVVADYAGLNEPINGSNSIGWSIVLSNEGANDAANGHGLRPAEPRIWGDFGIIFGEDPLKFKMSVKSLGGDFDGDGMLTSTDIDLLSAEIRAGSMDVVFDINSDGIVNLADHQHWVESADYAHTFIGDANLDGTVDFPDFLALSAGFGQSGGWAQGDFDGNGNVDFPDFLALSANFGKTGAQAAAVPEPTATSPLLFGVMGLICFRRRFG